MCRAYRGPETELLPYTLDRFLYSLLFLFSHVYIVSLHLCGAPNFFSPRVFLLGIHTMAGQLHTVYWQLPAQSTVVTSATQVWP